MRCTRRIASTLGVLLGILAAGAGACFPGVAPAQGPGQDSATGAFTAFSADLSLDAHSGPSGENPGGTFTAPAGVFSVVCLQISGRTAVIAANSPFFSVLLQVVDGPVDTLAVDFPPGTLGADSCEVPPAAAPVPITSGNIVVVDAQALPTAKEQCKRGGWRSFGDTFKNQGQCVAFVQRGPKP